MEKVKVEEVIGFTEFYEVSGEFKSGLTWRSMLALLYSLFIFTPAVIYTSLVTLGGALGTAVEYATQPWRVQLAF